MGSAEKIKCGYVTGEGDMLYYKVRGEGIPLLFIAPGGGDGDNYLPIADILSDKYKVITYDRRANARSTRNFPNEFSIRQQSRDAVAILNEVCESSAFIIGNSSGAVIALDMATAYPTYVKAAVIHEAPIPSVLPEHEKWERFFASCNSLGLRFGSSVGATKFFFGIEMPAMQLIKATGKGGKYAKNERTIGDEKRMSSKASTDVLVRNELLPITSYVPDFPTLKSNDVKIYIACGKYGLGKNTWYARASKLLAEKMGCELIAFPGHHGSFMDNPTEWADTLLPLLRE